MEGSGVKWIKKLNKELKVIYVKVIWVLERLSKCERNVKFGPGYSHIMRLIIFRPDLSNSSDFLGFIVIPITKKWPKILTKFQAILTNNYTILI